jgi:hypothetical protein
LSELADFLSELADFLSELADFLSELAVFLSDDRRLLSARLVFLSDRFEPRSAFSGSGCTSSTSISISASPSLSAPGSPAVAFVAPEGDGGAHSLHTLQQWCGTCPGKRLDPPLGGRRCGNDESENGKKPAHQSPPALQPDRWLVLSG